MFGLRLSVSLRFSITDVDKIYGIVLEYYVGNVPTIMCYDGMIPVLVPYNQGAEK